MIFRSLILTLLVLFSACTPGNKDGSFKQSHLQWQKDRIERLMSKTGWLNLAGLHWLNEGENTVGSDSSNNIIFPDNAPANLGSYFLENKRIRFVPHPGSGVLYKDSPAPEMDIKTDKTGHATSLEYSSLAWFIIERGEGFAIRLRDYEHPTVQDFHGIESFPPSEDWLIQAVYNEFETPMEIMTPNVLGTEDKTYSPGVLRFNIGDKTQQLYPTEAGESFFIVFADETSGLETYGGGRFLYVKKPENEGTVLIDFNRAYNPPCAFTPFATCPLPPRENILTVRIEAGEQFSGH